MELSTANPKQSPVVPLASPRLDTRRQATRISQPRYSPSRGNPPGSKPFSTHTQEHTTNTSELYDPPNQTVDELTGDGVNYTNKSFMNCNQSQILLRQNYINILICNVLNTLTRKYISWQTQNLLNSRSFHIMATVIWEFFTIFTRPSTETQ